MNKPTHHDHSHHQSHATGSADATTAKDPVCGMTVDLDAGKSSRVHNGETYHFCSPRCHDKFAADPESFLLEAHNDKNESPPKGAQYTCPMHPEILRDAPGDCPICGMALEPMGIPATDEGPNPELVDFKRRFLIGAVVAEFFSAQQGGLGAVISIEQRNLELAEVFAAIITLTIIGVLLNTSIGVTERLTLSGHRSTLTAAG